MTAAPADQDTTPVAASSTPEANTVLAAAGLSPDRTYKVKGEMARAVHSMWWRSRVGLAPIGVMAGLYGAAVGLHENAANPLMGAALPAAALAAALTKAKVRAWLAAEPWRRTWTAGCLAAAASWTSAAAAAGLDGNLLPATLVAASSALAAPWWFVHRWVERKKWEAPARSSHQGAAEQESAAAATAVDAKPEQPAIEAATHPHQIRWDTTLGKDELKGTSLEQPETVLDHKGEPNGAAFVINGSDARVSWTRMFQKLSDIYAAYDGPDVEKLVHVERHKGWETRARIVFLERDPFAEVIEWSRPGLDPARGKLPFAVYPDGSGWAPYTLYVPGWGVPHDQVVGETGSGKGGGLRLIVIESLAFGSRVILMDPHQNGALEECTGLIRNPLATPQEILAGMCGVEAALEERIRIRSEVGKKRFGPEFGHNILHVVVDETSQVIVDKEIARILGRVYREGRKFWIKGTLADQSTAFGDLLGHSGAVIRDQAQGGNSVLYRVSPAEGRRANPGVALPVPLHALPKWVNEELEIRATGVGYVLGATERALKSRTQWVSDSAFAAWCPPIEKQVLDDRTEEAFQRAFEQAMAGMDGTESLPSPRRVHDDGAAGGKVTALHPQADPEEDERLTRRLLEFLHDRGGHATRAEISDARICPAANAHRLLVALEKSGEVTQPQRGEFRLRAS
ncbi:hypothetical protein ABZ897_01055 [Nonomuraea sp. NPDC046802]|uniref:hypothetical protein n=1 Tax=Nonomuraea sp. NPDC046802 TaxID=3154919 RepID=UPI0033F1C904